MTTSRRDFFRGFARGSTAAVAGLAAVRQTFAETVTALRDDAARAGADPHRDGGYWVKVRKQFMLEDGLAYMNTGTLGPTPRPVYDALVEYWRLMALNPNEKSDIFQNHVDAIRVQAAGLLGVEPDELAITRNTTEGNTILCHGLDLKQGDEILITAFEHASNRETWMRQARRFGFSLKEVTFPLPPAGPQVILDAFAAAISPRTRVMHFANPLGSYGCYVPVRDLARMAHAKNILCFVDGAHATGMVRFNLKEWEVDGFACNSHKWLCGAAGAGMLYVRREIQDRVWPNIGIWRDPPRGARKYEAVARRPWPTVMALGDILDFHTAVGASRIEERGRALGAYLRQQAAAIPKVKIYTPFQPAMSAAVTTLGIEGVPGARLKELLRQKYDTYVPGGGDRIRFSTHYFNTFEQVDRVLAALGELARGGAA